jgi:hypothetical protein
MLAGKNSCTRHAKTMGEWREVDATACPVCLYFPQNRSSPVVGRLTLVAFSAWESLPKRRMGHSFRFGPWSSSPVTRSSQLQLQPHPILMQPVGLDVDVTLREFGRVVVDRSPHCQFVVFPAGVYQQEGRRSPNERRGDLVLFLTSCAVPTQNLRPGTPRAEESSAQE